MKTYSILLFLLIHCLLFGQTSKDVIVQLDVKDQSIREVLHQIEDQTQLKFSYNTKLINRDSVLSYRVVDISLEQVIDELFFERISPKVIGRHIVLLEKQKEKKKATKARVLFFAGQLINARTQQPIENASIYDISSRETVLSDSLGQFELQINSSIERRNFGIAKRSYLDTIISVDLKSNMAHEIRLKPMSIKIAQMAPKSTALIPIEQKSDFLMGMVSKDALITSENLSYIYEQRLAQVSFFPIIGTNLTSSGIIENKMSLNVFGGYNGGVRGFELGGLFNIVDNNVTGLQIGGLSNMVAGKTKGAQFAGLVNKNKKDVIGLQIAGVGNWTSDSLRGVQIAGIFNLNQGSVVGLQIGGIVSTSLGNVEGAQYSGIANIIATDLKGIQIVGISNLVKGDALGLQLAGITNVNKGNTKGLQISGISNLNKGDLTGMQLSYIYNHTEEKMKGLQIGLINTAKLNKGLQMGLINLSDSSNGVSIGLINIVRNGYYALELSATEMFYSNLSLKTGARHFYNIYQLGFSPGQSSVFGVGFGFGSNFTLYKKLSMSIDATVHFVENTDEAEDDFNAVNTLGMSLDYQLAKHFAISLGASYKTHYSKYGNTFEEYFNSEIPVSTFNVQRSTNYYSQSWIGAKLALRYIF